MRRIAWLALLLLLAGCGWGEESEMVQDSPSVRHGQTESFDGVPIAYTVAGEGEGALLFIHGWACDRNYWEGQLAEFSQAQQVVTVDLAGHGDSGLGREEWTLQSFGRDVQAVAEVLDLETVVLVGHSMGGPVALEAARLMPGRVIGIVGVDTLHYYEFEWPENWDEQLDAYETDFVGQCGEFVESMFVEEVDAELVTEVRTDMCAAPPEIAVAVLRAMQVYDLPAAAHAAGVPIRCVNAAYYPTRVEANRKHSPDFDVYVMEQVGHFPMLERPEEFNHLLGQAIEEITGAAI